MGSKDKIIVLGLDGASPDLIFPWIKEGKLPAFKLLTERGIYGSLRSTIPPVTGAAWPSFMTGKNPGKHGTFDFVRYNPLAYDGWKEQAIVTSDLFAGTTFFDLLSYLGYTMGVITVPVTYPVWDVNGFMIAGYPCPDTNKNYICSRWKDLEIEGRLNFHADYYKCTPEDQILADGLSMMEKRTRLALKAMEQFQLDCLIMVLGAIDRAQHDFWKYHDPEYKHRHPEKNDQYRDAIFRHYQKADWALQELMKKMDDRSTLFVLSDHGGGSHPSTYFQLTRWLGDRGFLTYKTSKSYVYKRLRSLKKKLEKLVFKGHRTIRTPMAVQNKFSYIERVDWKKTKAFVYPMQFPAAGIVINVAGRQSSGVVKPGGEYEELRSHIIEQLLDLVDPQTNVKVVSHAFRREDIYHGEHVQHAPDVVFLTNEGYEAFQDPNKELEHLFSPVDEDILDRFSGLHRMQGIFFAYGKQFREGKEVHDLSIVDVAPTILYSMKVAIPHDMDGHVPLIMFKDSYTESQTIQYRDPLPGKASGVSILSAEEEASVKEKLKGLGYIR